MPTRIIAKIHDCLYEWQSTVFINICEWVCVLLKSGIILPISQRTDPHSLFMHMWISVYIDSSLYCFKNKEYFLMANKFLTYNFLFEIPLWPQFTKIIVKGYSQAVDTGHDHQIFIQKFTNGTNNILIKICFYNKRVKRQIFIVVEIRLEFHMSVM